MGKKIDRLLVWFQTEEGSIRNLSDLFYGLSFLYNTLLNEKYDGKKIKFININLETLGNYKKNPQIPLHYTHYYNGHLNFYGLFEKELFESLSYHEQTVHIWNKIHESLIECSKATKNQHLLDASNYAYKKGIDTNLNTDYKIVETTFCYDNENYTASVWFLFEQNAMYSKLLIEKEDGTHCYEKEIDHTILGNEYFLTIYKSIYLEGNTLILKGKSDIDYLPMKFDLNQILS